jgi:uncharacterized protein (TIGR03437 family)
MWKLTACLMLVPLAAVGQTAGTTLFRAVLSPGSEVPVVGGTSHGVADVTVSAVRDNSGRIVSGTIDVLTRVTFTAAATVTGIGIWSGAAGQNGSLVLNTGLTAGNSFAAQANGDFIDIPIQVTGDNTTALGALRNLLQNPLQNPSQFYVNVLTTASPNGAFRGQLQPAQVAVLLANMSSDNVVPAAYPQGYGVAQVIAIGTQSTTGAWTSGEVYLSTTYTSQDTSTFTGFHIHQGGAGITGAIALAAPLPGGMTPDPSKSGVIGPFYLEISTTTAAQTAAFTNLFVNPAALYIDLHTTASPNGMMRAQLRSTDAMPFGTLLSSMNELHATSVNATAPVNLTLYTTRNQDGSVTAGTMLADVDYRFPSPVQFIGLTLHNGPPDEDAPALIQVAPDFHSDTGFGNYHNWSAPIGDAVTLNDLVANPEHYYLNLHTLSDPGGAVRAQLATRMTASAGIAAVISADLDKNATTLAPGELISIFGANLAKVSTDLRGWTGSTLPFFLNGVSVDVAGRQAPLLYVSPGQINAQIPVDAPAGPVAVTVSNGNALGTAYTVSLAAIAPAIFFSPVPAVLKNADFSLVSSSNPAKAGDVLLIYATGLGQTAPAIATGGVVGAGVLAQTAPVTATIGGKSAPVIYSIASPGAAGLYQVAVTVPSGLTGNVALMISEGGVASNSVLIALR